tara:strand:+ start:107 stop:319 length:213 start_codon:yes stop_codon:yes gene_type:complete
MKPAKERICDAMNKFIAKQPRDPFGHGYLWVTLRNGSKFCIGIYGHQNHTAIIDHAKEQVGVDYAYINLD